MALYAIGDLHLSLSTNKLMEKFGEIWKDHIKTIIRFCLLRNIAGKKYGKSERTLV